MVIVVSTWHVPDFGRWKEALDDGLARSDHSGLRAYRICRALDDPDEILVEFEFDSLRHATEWMARADGAWLARSGLDVYPPMFVGEPIEDHRTVP